MPYLPADVLAVDEHPGIGPRAHRRTPSITASRNVRPSRIDRRSRFERPAGRRRVRRLRRIAGSSTSTCARGASPQTRRPRPFADRATAPRRSREPALPRSLSASRSPLLEIAGLDDAFALEPRRIRRDRIAPRPVVVQLAIHVPLIARCRVFPGRMRIAAQVQHVVVVGVPAHAHRHELDQRGSCTRARPLDGPGERRRNRIGIGAVEREARDPVARRLVGEHPRSRLIGDRSRQRRLIVLDAEDRRQAADRTEIDGLVPFAQRTSAFADERKRDTPRGLPRERHRHAGDSQRGDRQRRGRRKNAPVEIPDVQILAVERRAGLGHLGVQRHPHGVGLMAHGEGDAQIANHRSDHVAVPASVGSAIAVAAPQPDSRCVDGFLAERTKPFALKCRRAVPYLAAR